MEIELTREEYYREHFIRGENYKKDEWQAEQGILEKQYVENFVKSAPPLPEILEKLEQCLLAQKWISAKSSAHQYMLMKDFIEVGDVEYDDITSAIGKYGFLVITGVICINI